MNKKYDEIKCIWADSGIIGYKLCDKLFDCENCELDKVLKKTAYMNTENENNEYHSKNILNKISSEIHSLTFDNHYYYLKNYLCIKNLFGDKYFLGISPLLFGLFLNTECNFKCIKDYFIKSGEKLAELSGYWGSIDISSPLTLNVLKEIPKNNQEYYSVNWIAIVELKDEELKTALIKSDKFNSQKEKIAAILKSKESNYPSLIHTMYDGGKIVKNLSELLGESQFVHLINQIIKISG